MKNTTFLSKLAAGALLSSALAVPAQQADARLDSFFKAYLSAKFQLQPSEGSRLGDHRFDAQLETPTAEAETQWSALMRKTLDQLPGAVAYSQLSRASQIDYETFERSLRYDLWLAQNTHRLAEDPRAYNDYINDSVYLLLTQSSLPLEVNVSNCISRMALIPSVIDAAKQNLRNPPRAHTETAIKQNLGAIAFYESDLFAFAGKTRQRAALEAAAKPLVACLKDYQKFLENDLLPRANGVWRLGEEKFNQKLDFELDAGVTADQVLADAESEFTRVERDMYVIARQLWGQRFPKQALPPDDADGRTLTVRRVLASLGQEHGTPETLTKDAKRRVVLTKAFITDNDILRLPNPDRCQVVEMPEFRRGNSTAYMEAAPPLDPDAAAHYAISPPPKDWDAAKVRSYLEEYNNYMMDILTIHEGYPGHAVQLQYMNRNPSLIRRVLQSNCYIEGWAVYTEQMMVDQGYGGGGLGLRMNQLKFYLRAVANSILDHKMHCSNLSDEEALDFLTRRCFQSEGEARLKIIRAKQSSCQLSTYFVGRMAHYRLRQQIERESGATFSLGRYHEAVLNCGAVSTKYLPELVRFNLGIQNDH